MLGIRPAPPDEVIGKNMAVKTEAENVTSRPTQTGGLGGRKNRRKKKNKKQPEVKPPEANEDEVLHT